MAQRRASGLWNPLTKRSRIRLTGRVPSEGHEEKGRRPVLIVSPEAFNQVTRVPGVVPITSGGSFARTAGFAFSLSGAGTLTTGVIRCGQSRARGGKKLEAVPAAVMEEVLARLAAIFE
jgi:mRNA-degrading endonuclease toxin of MazEF toxin-antitoxin module